MVWAILVEGHLRNMQCNYLKIHTLIKEKKLFKGFFYFCVAILNSAKQFVQFW